MKLTLIKMVNLSITLRISYLISLASLWHKIESVERPVGNELANNSLLIYFANYHTIYNNITDIF